MPLNLTTVVDGVTEVNAASVNQYKNAIETLAGSWNDANGDLRVRQLSDEVKAARGSKGSLDARLDVVLQEDGTLKDSSVSKANMASGVLSGAGTSGQRPSPAKAGFLYHNTTDNTLERDTGSAFSVVTACLTEAQRQDLTDGGVCTIHTHAPGDHGHTGPGDGGTLGAGVITNTQVAANANIAGTKIAAATTSARGTVELAESGERTAGLAVQASDGGLLSPNEKSVLTSFGLTELHKHEIPATVYCDHTVSLDGTAELLPEYTMPNPGGQSTWIQTKIRAAWFKSHNVRYICLYCIARLTDTLEEYEDAYVGINVASCVQVAKITMAYPLWEHVSIVLDVSSVSEDVWPVSVFLRWINSQNVEPGNTLQMKHVSVKALEVL